ncbi:amino acid ABC transporter permease [Yersinia mollaretii]|uniref:Glutamate/aspartate import permease protein GltK n=1 Tax=Yersinia mollaretii TaxID=33060 RepID=A0AA44I1A8_YERMO|nr:amino acid ABC transporter permease [Yersinia mollaretii]NIL24345.1 amino acid ABC transporter permease [Yersinia mollaretii]CNJ28606.1 amino acid transport system permease [Yersinia mollaretii]CNL12302.1 amino acid transport system permease [Yersinia enterocolitica]CQR11684.1 amino acid transport system permease [Yersinia mollaretii]
MDFTIIADNWSYLLWGTYPDGPLGGAALTVLISLMAGVASAILGTILGVALAMSRGVWAGILAAVLGFFRAIPVIMLIFWTYFLLPIVFGVDIPEITTVVCALALIASAYLAHAVKAGIVAIGPGQWQAGLSLGFNRWQVLWFVVLPQALRMMVPSFINQWISLIKDTSLAYIVGVNELTFLATQVNNRSMVYPMEVFLFVALVYFVLCLALDLLANGLNRRFSPQHAIKKQSAIKRSWRWWRNKVALPATSRG